MSYQLTETLRLVWNWGNFVHEDVNPRLVDVSKGKELATLTGHTDYICGASMMGPDQVVTWSNDRTIRIWTLDGTCLHTLSGHSGYVRSVEVLEPDLLASTAGDDRLILWSLKDGTSRIIEDLGKDLWLMLSRKDRVLIRSADRTHYVVDTNSGKRLATLEFGSSLVSTYPFDDGSFLIAHDQGLERIRWHDGVELYSAQVRNQSGRPWRCVGLVPLKDGKAFVAGYFYSQPGRAVFHVFDMDNGALLAHRSIAGGEVLWMTASADGAAVTAQLKDYRRLTLDTGTLTTLQTSGVTGYEAEGFTCYAPEDEPSGTTTRAEAPSLSVTWLYPRKATCAVFDGNGEDVDVNACCVLSDGSIAIAFGTHWRVYSDDLTTYETLAKDAFWALYPDHFALVHWSRCKSGRLPALAMEASRHIGCDARVAKLAARQLQKDLGEALYFAPGRDGRFLAYSPKTFSIWCLHETAQCFDLTVENQPDTFVGHTILRGHSGQVMRLGADGLRPAKTVSNTALYLHQDAFSANWNVHLRPNGHLLIRSWSGLTVLDSETGETLAVLESGHGMGMWGMLAGDTGPIMTWSRTSLRSWDPETYAPLVEIKDPEDWGPGYEFLCQSPSGQVLFTPGEHTYDGRIMIWDGRHRLAVYAGHGAREVDQIKALTPELYISRESYQNGIQPVRLWRCPAHVFSA